MLSSQFTVPLEPINITPNRCGRSRDEASQRIIIMRLGSHGDVLMGTPLIKALRNAYPYAWLTWIIEGSERESLDANPYLDELLIWRTDDFRPRKSLTRILARWSNFKWLKRELQKRQFDAFLSFQAEEWSQVTKMVDAKLKIGFFDYFNVKPVNANDRKSIESLFNFVVTKNDHPVHRTDQFLSVLKFLNIDRPTELSMHQGYTKEDAASMWEKLIELGLGADEPYFVVAPMSTWVTRNWPIDRYAACADRVANLLKLRPVLIGSRREIDDIAQLASKMTSKPVVLAGTLGFRQLGVLIDSARLLIGGDSGPMHVAGAVNTPYVAIFGSTPVSGRAPLAGRGKSIAHAVPCGPCDWLECKNSGHPLLCLDLVEVKEVVDAAIAIAGSASNDKKERVATRQTSGAYGLPSKE